MTQTTGFPSEAAGAPEANAPRQQPAAGPSFVYDPWAQPSETATATAPARRPAGAHAVGAQTSAAHTAGAPAAGVQSPAYPYAGHPYAQQPPAPPAPPNGPGGSRGSDSRRPGWLALGGATLSAALLASLLTAGVINALDENTPSTFSSSAQRSSTPSGPVTSSTAANPDWEAVAASASKSVVAI